MGNRNRNTALVLIAAGLFLLLGRLIGFFTVAAIVVIWLGIQKVRQGEDKTGYVLLGIGVVFLLGDHFALIVAIVLISLGYSMIRSKQVHRNEDYVQKQNIVQSLKWTRDAWVLRNMSTWSIIGEIHLDFTLALPEEPETTVMIQGIVGDVDILVPEDMGVQVQASVLFGQADIGTEREAGFLNKAFWKSPNYEECEHKVKIMVSYIVGDVDVKVM